MSTPSVPTRYHPLLVTLHWLMAVMIIVALITGGFLLAETPNSAPEKVGMLRSHMIAGMAILVLMIIRLIVRTRTSKPAHADTGNAFLNRAGVWTHWAFYALVILMAASGIGISVLAGLPPIVFGGTGDPLPVDFWAYPPRYAHWIFGTLLGLLVVLHVAAFGWHQWGKKDALFARMWFGNRNA